MLDQISKYIYTVYKLKSVSLAAKELYISQPALSSAIRKEEKRIGAEIFDRKTLPFSLTNAGKVYIQAIEKIIDIEKNVKNHIADINDKKSGTLRIATSTHLSFFVIPKILEVFHNEYPRVDIHVLMLNTDELVAYLLNKRADLIFTPAEISSNELQSHILLEERLVVAVSRKNVPESLRPFSVTKEELIEGSYNKKREITDLSVFEAVDFVYNTPNTNIHRKKKLLFGKSDVQPYITSNADQLQLNYNLMCSGFGAVLLTDANVATMNESSECSYFVLSQAVAKQSFSIVHTKEGKGHGSDITTEFINVAKSLFENENPLKILTA